MSKTEEVDRLKRQLNWEGGGPLAEPSSRAMNAMKASGRAFASWVRKMAEDRPLISLLIAVEVGFAVGHWGPRRAKH